MLAEFNAATYIVRYKSRSPGSPRWLMTAISQVLKEHTWSTSTGTPPKLLGSVNCKPISRCADHILIQLQILMAMSLKRFTQALS